MNWRNEHQGERIREPQAIGLFAFGWFWWVLSWKKTIWQFWIAIDNSYNMIQAVKKNTRENKNVLSLGFKIEIVWFFWVLCGLSTGFRLILFIGVVSRTGCSECFAFLMSTFQGCQGPFWASNSLERYAVNLKIAVTTGADKFLSFTSRGTGLERQTVSSCVWFWAVVSNRAFGLTMSHSRVIIGL